MEKIGRFVFDIILLLSVFILPWWFFVIMAVIGGFVFPFFAEMIVIGLVVDILYHVPVDFFFLTDLIYFFVGLALFLVIEAIKKKTRVNV